jgi:hypothetical protein
MDSKATGARIETERLLLRWLTFDDIDAFNELGSNPQVIRYLGNRPFASARCREGDPFRSTAAFGSKRARS